MIAADTRADEWRLAGRTVVVFGSFCSYDWDQLRQRQQELVERLGRLAEVYYVERHGATPLPPLRIVRAVLKRFAPARPGAGMRRRPEGVTFVRAPLVPLHGLRLVDAFNAWVLERRLRRVVPVALERCTALTTYPSPYVRQTLKRVPFETHVHDSAQRYGESPEIYGARADIIDRELAAMADLATCDSVTIRADRLAEGIDAFRMPQGYGRRFVGDARPSRHRERLAALRQEGPVVGFVGALSEVVDWRLLGRVASLMPEARFVLVGPRLCESVPVLPGNVVLLGWVPPDEVPDVIDGFDVAMVPYVLDRRTKAVMPTKLAEYVARGVRVVSVPLPDVAEVENRFPALVKCAQDPGLFASAIGSLLKRGRRGRERLIGREWRDWSWDVLFEKYVARIEDVRSTSAPGVLLVGLNYRPGWTASDKNFMRGLVSASVAEGLQPIVLSIGRVDGVLAEAVGGERHATVYSLARPLHPRRPGAEMTPSAHRHFHERRLIEYAERVLCCLALRRRIAWAARRHQAVAVHYFDNLGPGMRFAAGRLPSALTLIGSTGSRENLVRRALWRTSLGRIDSLVCGSVELAESVPAVCRNRVTVIPWAAADAFEPADAALAPRDRSLVVWSGPLQGGTERELRVALEAMRLARRSAPEMDLRIWPKPEYAAGVEATVGACGGAVVESPGRGFAARLREARILVSPVMSAQTVVGPPLTWLEAVACGVTVVSTPCLGVSRELLESGAIVLAESTSVESVARAIVQAWETQVPWPVSLPSIEDAAKAYAMVWREAT